MEGEQSGLNMPLRATSIMPLDVTTPMMMPTDATVRIIFIEAALEPIAELEKIDCVVRDADERPETARIPQNADNDGVDFAHVGVLVQIVNKFTPFFPMKWL